jgi:hypothetical protein
MSMSQWWLPKIYHCQRCGVPALVQLQKDFPEWQRSASEVSERRGGFVVLPAGQQTRGAQVTALQSSRRPLAGACGSSRQRPGVVVTSRMWPVPSGWCWSAAGVR